jgi:hypothetical protein
MRGRELCNKSRPERVLGAEYPGRALNCEPNLGILTKGKL